MPKIAALIACGTDGQKAIVDGLLCYITEMIYSLQRKYRGLFEEMLVYCRKEAPIFRTDIQQTGNYIKVFFFCQGFLSRTLTNYRTALEGLGPSFISLYQFHPLTNIQGFICNLHVR